MVTLEQVQTGLADKVDQNVVKTFRQSSELLDKLVFDDAVSPTGNGSTLTYGYLREKAPATADFRELGKEYSAQESTTEKKNVDLKIFGGSFEIDRVIAKAAKPDEVTRQMSNKIKAAASLFHFTVINGDDAVDAKSFDGLNKALLGSDTEFNADAYLDLSTEAAMEANYKQFLDLLDLFLYGLDGKPSFLMGNNYMMTKIKSAGRRSGYLSQQEDAFGRSITTYDGIPLLDLGYHTTVTESAVKESQVVKIETKTIAEASVTGLTDLYAPVIDLDHFHGVTVTGNNIINSYLPDFTTSGAVKKGEAEMIAAIALKHTRGAGVLRNIKVR